MWLVLILKKLQLICLFCKILVYWIVCELVCVLQSSTLLCFLEIILDYLCFNKGLGSNSLFYFLLTLCKVFCCCHMVIKLTTCKSNTLTMNFQMVQSEILNPMTGPLRSQTWRYGLPCTCEHF